MSTATETIQEFVSNEYKYGFVSNIETDTIPPGLDEDVIRLISAKKAEPEFMLNWRLKSFRHWLTMQEPNWQQAKYPPIDYQRTIYYAAPRPKKQLSRMRSGRSLSAPQKRPSSICGDVSTQQFGLNWKPSYGD